MILLHAMLGQHVTCGMRLLLVVSCCIQHACAYSYSGRLTYGSYSVGPAEQIRLNYISKPQPYLAYYNRYVTPNPPAACTISWVSQLHHSQPVVYESSGQLQGDNASAFYAHVQLQHSGGWGGLIPGYASVYVESRCGKPRLVSSVEILDCLQGSSTRDTRRFSYRVRNAEMRGTKEADMTPVNDWSEGVEAKLPPVDGEVHVAMIADMTDIPGIEYNSSIPGVTDLSRRGEIDAVMHAGDVAYDIDDDCGDRGDQFMRSISGISAIVPYIFAPGDHEGGRKDLVNRNCGGDYEAMVARLAGAGGGGSPGQLALSHGSGSPSIFYFSFDVGLIHFAVVNSNAWVYSCQHWMLPAMHAWLDRDLASVNRTKTPWIVLISHRQAYCVKNNDTECNQEARCVRYGVPAEALALGINIYDGWAPRPLDGKEDNQYGLEELCHKHKVDIQFGGHPSPRPCLKPDLNPNSNPNPNSLI